MRAFSGLAIAVAAMIWIWAAPAARAADCGDLQTQTEMTICAGDAFKKTDAELNKLYRQIQERLTDDADTRRLLVATQRAWVSFRDAECAFRGSAVAGGSAEPMIVSQCNDNLTRLRIEDLKGYLACQEGDLDCPVPAAE
ncbi:hypothetical protein K32_12960 [Kaistia sp. 32K]|uniref:lysozyme inhibitor LprI family protein n=1 Tax=Kaistia sp. 32K TaxID=2795690 RepID=UPI001934B7E8|nr:lysozyme inhibitor LprI family protein [Kaistia sp. 32K]BCP52679.1 hypothetical protein K32_12960 [Kaistia sp. 32K]